MDAKIAAVLMSAAEEIGLDNFDVRDDYSGRGMYGSKTHAITCDNNTDLIKAVAVSAGRVVEDGDEDMRLDDFVEHLDFRFDNMGLGIVAY